MPEGSETSHAVSLRGKRRAETGLRRSLNISLKNLFHFATLSDDRWEMLHRRERNTSFVRRLTPDQSYLSTPERAVVPQIIAQAKGSNARIR